MDHEEQIVDWISQDAERMRFLELAAGLNLKDWCLAAGFVRTLIWDRLHGFKGNTQLSDIDLIYFDLDLPKAEDKEIEKDLCKHSNDPWSVKNQAHMHIRNDDNPYQSSADAMTYWVEEQAAIGARINKDKKIEIIAPFGLDIFFDYTIRFNHKRPKPDAFECRIKSKRWLKKWPKLKVVY